ncbi:hypothetical protein AVEN_120373-1 [Araneus ventricosus]|uniref:Uncharacterized protein n=1 Tax=Araneus ventricosus TaxID=182803 RepID=A0A4Y2Q6F3_ARAVE|nr:hypothetical protein AVEN_120373-1 [Araneus ventricosus]
MIPAESCQAEKPSGGRRSQHRVGVVSRPPSSLKQHKRTIQIYRHKEGLAVLCFRDRSYCLTNGMKSRQGTRRTVRGQFAGPTEGDERHASVCDGRDQSSPLGIDCPRAGRKASSQERSRGEFTERDWRLSDLQEELREVGGRLWNQLHQKGEGGNDTSQYVKK